MREISRVYRDVVDHSVFDVWAKLLTIKDLQRAFGIRSREAILALHARARAAQATAYEFASDETEARASAADAAMRTLLKPFVYIVEQAIIAGLWWAEKASHTPVPDVVRFGITDRLVENEHPELDELMLKHGLLDVKNSRGETPLIYSVLAFIKGYDRFERRASWLISNGANLNAQDEDNMTALMFCCHSSRTLGLLKELIAHKAKLELRRQPTGDTALLQTMSFDMRSYIEERIKAVVYKGPKDRTDGAYTTFIGPELVIALLIEAGARVNTQNNEGLTALHITLRKDLPNFTRRFLDTARRVDVNIADNNGITPLMLLLTTMTGDMGYGPQFDTSDGEDRLLARIVGLGATLRPMDIKDQIKTRSGKSRVGPRKGLTPFMIAYNPTAMKILLDHAEDNGIIDMSNDDFFWSLPKDWQSLENYLDAQDEQGMTALLHIIDYYNALTAATVRGARLEFGDGPMAAKMRESIALLIEHGADPRIADNTGRTPLSEANETIAKILKG